MNRYNPEVFATLQKAAKQPFDNVKPLWLNLIQFYDFMLQRRLNKDMLKVPRGSSKTVAIFDMLETENNNPLSVYVHPDIAYLPDGDVAWSIRKYE